MAEIRTVKAAQLSTDRALEKAEGALAGLKDRLLGAEGARRGAGGRPPACPLSAAAI